MSPSPRGDHLVAVAVANAEHVRQLMRTALDVAREHDGRVFVVSVVVQPHSSPFRVFTDEVIKEEFSGDRRELLDRALAVAEGTDVPVEGRLVVGNDIASGIVRAVSEYDVDTLLMGWHARRHRDLVMGHTIDDVVASTTCDVLVEKIGQPANGVESILLPAGADVHTELAASVSRAIARANDARVDVVRVVAPDATDDERAEAEALARDVAAEVGEELTDTRVIEGANVVAALRAAAETRDLTVMGGGRRGRVRQFVVGSTSRQLGRRVSTTIVIATRPRGPRSWRTRLLTSRLLT